MGPCETLYRQDLGVGAKRRKCYRLLPIRQIGGQPFERNFCDANILKFDDLYRIVIGMKTTERSNRTKAVTLPLSIVLLRSPRTFLSILQRRQGWQSHLKHCEIYASL